MLARPHRLARGADYRQVVRRGARCGGSHTVMYVVKRDGTAAARFGFIVSKQVGNAVTRNTVRRRLKAICHRELAGVAPGVDVVVRALPSAEGASFSALSDEVSRCLRRRAAG